MTVAVRKPATLVRRALAGHAAIGLLASALLYIIALTGTLVVIHDRWQRWEQPAIAEMTTLSPAAAQAGMAAVIASEAGKPKTTHLYVRMPSSDLPRTVVTTDRGGWYIDGTGRPVAREANSWTEFLIGLHEYLHLPATWGLIVVGALGVALAALVLTGVLAHPRILRDAFRLRTRHEPQIARADWHNRIGVWTMPFVLAIALTGAFIGLGSVGFTVLAKAYTGGDVDKVYAPIFGHEPKPDGRPAALPDIATALRTLALHEPDARPTYIIVHDPETRGQHIQIIAELPRRLIYGETYAFDGRGVLRGATGLSDGAVGQQTAASAYNLHFGNYGGLAVELAYMLMGTGLCVVIATGTTLWLQKRRRRGLDEPRLTAGWDMAIWGTPLLLLIMLWLRALAGANAPLALAFWCSLAIGLAISTAKPRWIDRQRLRRAVLGSMFGTASLHMLIFWPPRSIVALDGILMAMAALGIYLESRKVDVASA